MEVSWLFAFTAGLLSFFSPCVFPLLPVYAANLTGALISTDKIQVSRSLLIIRSLGFVAGFSAVFTLLGASASFLGQFVMDNKATIEKIGGAVIIIFGLQLMGVFKLKCLCYEKQWDLQYEQQKGLLTSVLLGISFGVGWTPCVGLALSSILLLAGTESTAGQGAFLLLFYSLGLGIPFLLISLAITYSLAAIKRVNQYLGLISFISGLVLVVMGLMLVLGRFSAVSAWFANFTI
ncbi:MAG: cytochrome c biogenesis protein CcdA [Pelosinus sp.]|nr:cytochrome c biogenesis protein CcdA [Pelosinus sp.]